MFITNGPRSWKLKGPSMLSRISIVTNLLLLLLSGGSVLIFLGREWTGSLGSTQRPLPGTDAQELWQYITKDNPYKSWKTFPKLPGRFIHASEQPHGDWIAAY